MRRFALLALLVFGGCRGDGQEELEKRITRLESRVAALEQAGQVEAKTFTEAFGEVRRRSQIAAAGTQIEALQTPLEMYSLDVGDYPITSQGLEALRQAPADLGDVTKWNGPYLDRELPLDPWGNRYQYEWPGTHQQDFPDIWSLGPNGIDGDADDVVNWIRP
jgi:general secretion pathway protein G